MVPYAVVVPHSTVESAAWSVLQMIVASVGSFPDTLIALITGGGGGAAGVTKLLSALTAPWPVALTLLTR
jgi:hypothetical protein